MNDRRFDPVGVLISFTWSVVLCVVALVVAVGVLRDIWPWLLGIVLSVGVIVAAIRLTVWSRRRPW